MYPNGNARPFYPMAPPPHYYNFPPMCYQPLPPPPMARMYLAPQVPHDGQRTVYTFPVEEEVDETTGLWGPLRGGGDHHSGTFQQNVTEGNASGPQEGGGEGGGEDRRSSGIYPVPADIIRFADLLSMKVEQVDGQRILGPKVGAGDHHQYVEQMTGNEIFVAKIPPRCNEIEIFPMFANIGSIYKMRLMICFSGNHRGFCYIRYYSEADAQKAIADLNGVSLCGRKLIVKQSVDNNKILISGFPMNKDLNEIEQELRVNYEEIKRVAFVEAEGHRHHRRRFLMLEYDTHRNAALARRRFLLGQYQIFGKVCSAEWSEPGQIY